MKHNVFRPARSVRVYGYRDGRPIEQEGSPSGYLLPWMALDDEAEAAVADRPSQFVVIGEWVTPEGVRHPEIAVADAYMKWAGNDRVGGQWKRRELV